MGRGADEQRSCLLDGGVGEVQGGVRGRVGRGVPGGVVPAWRRMGSGCGSEMALRGSGCVTWEVGALNGAAVAVGEVGRREFVLLGEAGSNISLGSEVLA
jgi:hypothetical protein